MRAGGTPLRATTASAAGHRLGIVASRFNAEITERLVAGAIETLTALGAAREQIVVARVPGAFEIPLMAKLLVEKQHCAGVLCLGCIIRGETPHFDYIASSCAHGIQQAALTTGMPIIFGVLTVESFSQAEDRAGGRLGNMGVQGAEALVEMVRACRELKS
ncbi:MAG: 6,7-dimethyl-8-ribityllumazine synthase [Deltaproteobacteria bacterium]|nr:6,7-dimethyl-8-ribityllumazine synthase [Deltaproteobacteria bacterium]